MSLANAPKTKEQQEFATVIADCYRTKNPEHFFKKLKENLQTRTLDLNFSAENPSALWLLSYFVNKFNKEALSILQQIANWPEHHWQTQFDNITVTALLAAVCTYIDQPFNQAIVASKVQPILLTALGAQGAAIDLGATLGENSLLRCLAILALQGFPEPLYNTFNTQGVIPNFADHHSTDISILEYIILACQENPQAHKILNVIPMLPAAIWNESMKGQFFYGSTHLLSLIILAETVPTAWDLIIKIARMPELNWDATVLQGPLKGESPMRRLLHNTERDPRVKVVLDTLAKQPQSSVSEAAIKVGGTAFAPRYDEIATSASRSAIDATTSASLASTASASVPTNIYRSPS
jgi:hypothetical protein